MGTTSPGLLPYPEPTDPVAAGAANFKALADKIDPKLVQVFTSTADRNAKWPTPPKGAVCAVGASVQVWDGARWCEPGGFILDAALTPQANIPAAVTIGNSGFSLPSPSRWYEVSIMIHVFKGGATGDILITPNGLGYSYPAIVYSVPYPGRTTAYGSWRMSGAVSTGGAFAIQPAVGTVDVVTGFVRVRDAGGVFT